MSNIVGERGMGDDRFVFNDRAVVSVFGEEGRALLQRLLTNDVDALAAGQARYAALLTPQGKIVADFIVVPGLEPDELLLDAPASQAADLVKKLMLYRLRAKVVITDRSAALAVMAYQDEPPTQGLVVAYEDPRHPALWRRAIVDRAAAPIETDGGQARAAYDTARITAGVPAGGQDFAYGDTFPHEANLDHLNGVDFGKGCYVGQEIVSRVHHRGTARKRIVMATFQGMAPPPGTEVTAGDAMIGVTGSAAGTVGLATVRVDRVREVADPLVAGGVHLRLDLPRWA